MASADLDDALSCGVCFSPFASEGERRPFDMGCGHVVCEGCITRSRRALASCPECRRRSNPHLAVALVRVLRSREAAAAAASGGGGGGGEGDDGMERRRTRSAARAEQQAAAAAAAAAAAPASARRQQQHNPPPGAGVAVAGGTIEQHQAKVQEMRKWLWLVCGGLAYLLSPLDLVPDFLPLVGWVDDALVVCYVGFTLYRALRARG